MTALPTRVHGLHDKTDSSINGCTILWLLLRVDRWCRQCAASTVCCAAFPPACCGVMVFSVFGPDDMMLLEV